MNSHEIALSNDSFRKTFIGGKVLLTAGVRCSGYVEDIIETVKNFTQFTPDNDPHREHDFGAFTINGTKYFFKIDYYDNDYKYGADPYSEPFQRALTIMEASEY